MVDTKKYSENSLNGILKREMDYVNDVYKIINGTKKADLIINNVNIVDVFAEKVIHDSSIAIWENRIIAIDIQSHISANKYFDAGGLYAIPGLIDAHLHIESQLGTAITMAEGLSTHGTTSVISETLDLVSAAGNEGVKALRGFFKDIEKLPYRNYIFAGMKKVNLESLSDIFEWEQVTGLGEGNHLLINKGVESELKKIAFGRAKNILCSGHIDPTEFMNQVDMYAALGIINDHSHSSYEDLLHTLSCGIYIQLSELLGDPDKYIPRLLKDNINLEFITLAYDNCWIDKMIEEGHMDALVQKVIYHGVPPIKAIKMATINTANCFGLQKDIGSIAPGRYADIVLVPSIDDIEPLYVFKGGDLIAQEGRLTKQYQVDYSEIIKKTKRGLIDLEEEELEVIPLSISEDGHEVLVDIFDLSVKNPDYHKKVWLRYENNKIINILDNRILTPISIIQRYPLDGSKRHIINGYITDLSLDSGATAEIYPSPQWYITAIGNTAKERYFAAMEIDKITGGYLISHNDQVLGCLELPIYGWVSDLNATEIINRFKHLDDMGEMLGYKAPYYLAKEKRWFEIQRNINFQLDRYSCLENGEKNPWLDQE